MLLRTRVAAAIAALAVALTAPAMADSPHGDPPQDKGKPARPGHHEKGESAESNDEGHAKGGHSGEKGEREHEGADKDERHKRMLERFEERRKTRAERATSEREGLRHKLGASLENQAVQQELRRHAEAVARLERIKEIADAEGKTELSARASAVLAKENARHEKRLATLAASAAPAASASGGAP